MPTDPLQEQRPPVPEFLHPDEAEWYRLCMFGSDWKSRQVCVALETVSALREENQHMRPIYLEATKPRGVHGQ